MESQNGVWWPMKWKRVSSVRGSCAPALGSFDASSLLYESTMSIFYNE
jgi:hypothetical protein